MSDIRALGEPDRVAWRSLRFALWPRDDDGSFDKDITDTLASGGRLAAFGAFHGEHLVAFVEVGERPRGDGFDTAPVGWVEGIYVDPAHRRSGVGVAPIVGGIAAVKQERLLARRPEVVVATPGRLWDLMRSGLGASGRGWA